MGDVKGILAEVVWRKSLMIPSPPLCILNIWAITVSSCHSALSRSSLKSPHDNQIEIRFWEIQSREPGQFVRQGRAII